MPLEPIAIAVNWSPRTRWRADELLTRCGLHAARSQGFRTGCLSIAVVGDRRMSRLHWDFSRVPGTTDVLTFDLGSDLKRRQIDGEIAVCLPEARRVVARARALNASSAHPPADRRQSLNERVAAELALYVVHGVLHLAGHDDHEARRFARMHREEARILGELGLAGAYVRVQDFGNKRAK